MMKKTLIIVEDINRYFFQKYKTHAEAEFDVVQAYKGRYYILSKKIRRKNPIFFYERIGKLEKWKNNLEKYDKVIVFDSAYSNEIARTLGKHNFAKGKYFFYWNKMDLELRMVTAQMGTIQKYGFEVYSYNRTDCDRYKIKYNSTVFEPIIDFEMKKDVQKYDVVFREK